MPQTGRKLEAVRALFIRVLHTCVDAIADALHVKLQALCCVVTDLELVGASVTATTQFLCYVISILVIGNLTTVSRFQPFTIHNKFATGMCKNVFAFSMYHDRNSLILNIGYADDKNNTYRIFFILQFFKIYLYLN